MSVRLILNDSLSDNHDVVPVCSLITEFKEWQPYEFEGPPCLVRRVETVVEFAHGRVVAEYHREGKVMSDVYDTFTYAVIARDDGSFETLNCGPIGFNWPQDMPWPNLGVTVDAPEVLKVLYEAHQEVKRQESAEEESKRRQAYLAEKAKEPAKGKRVKVVRGRKVPIGTEGDCFWLGESRYGHRLGLKTSAGETVWVDAKNCEAVAA